MSAKNVNMSNDFRRQNSNLELKDRFPEHFLRFVDIDHEGATSVDVMEHLYEITIT